MKIISLLGADVGGILDAGTQYILEVFILISKMSWRTKLYTTLGWWFHPLQKIRCVSKVHFFCIILMIYRYEVASLLTKEAGSHCSTKTTFRIPLDDDRPQLCKTPKQKWLPGHLYEWGTEISQRNCKQSVPWCRREHSRQLPCKLYWVQKGWHWSWLLPRF